MGVGWVRRERHMRIKASELRLVIRETLTDKPDLTDILDEPSLFDQGWDDGYAAGSHDISSQGPRFFDNEEYMDGWSEGYRQAEKAFDEIPDDDDILRWNMGEDT